MSSPEFPGNSKRTPPPEEPRKIEQVVRTEAISAEKSLGRRFREMFVGGDSRSVVHYVITEVLLPQAKDMINEAVAQGVERLIFGEGRGQRGSSGRSNSSYTNYNKYARVGNNPIGRNVREERPEPTIQTKSANDIILQTAVEAEVVIERMHDLLRDYQQVSLADLYALVGWTATHVDNKWGWENLDNAGVRRVNNRGIRGYALNLPNTISLS